MAHQEQIWHTRNMSGISSNLMAYYDAQVVHHDHQCHIQASTTRQYSRVIYNTLEWCTLCMNGETCAQGDTPFFKSGVSHSHVVCLATQWHTILPNYVSCLLSGVSILGVAHIEYGWHMLFILLILSIPFSDAPCSFQMLHYPFMKICSFFI